MDRQDDEIDESAVYLFFLLMFQTYVSNFVSMLCFSIPSFARVLKLENLKNFVAAYLCATRKFTRQTKIRDDFEKFVACPDCHLQDECILKLPRNAQKCCYVLKAGIADAYSSSTGKSFLYPRNVYCYCGQVLSVCV